MHPDELARTIERYRNKGLLVDANLLLLHFVGQYDRDQIKKFKRTSAYTLEEFDLLERIVGFFSVLVTTPNILTEVSNLSNQLAERIRTQYYQHFKKQLLVLDEKYIPSVSVSQNSYFARFGLTDSVIVDLARNQYLVLTADLHLAYLLGTLGIDVINFNHIRYLSWT